MRPRLDSERGMALVAVMLMMFMMAALAAGMTMSGRGELALTTNGTSYAGARAAAEAGLNHGVVIALGAAVGTGMGKILRGPDDLVNAATPSAAVNADNGSLAVLIGGTPPWRVTATDARYTYDIRVIDDDDPSLYATALTAAQLTAMGENGSGVTDLNGKLVVRAWGYGPNGTQVEVETMLLPAAFPAVLINGTVTFSGSPRILGTSGSVHANTNLVISANGTSVAKNATATGTYTKPAGWVPGGVGSGGLALMTVPNIQASNYLAEADLVLTSTGLVQNRATGATVCNASVTKTACKTSYGWQFTSAAAGWTMNNATGTEATYYVQGPAILSASPGSTATPFRMGIIATGSITVTGSPKLAAEAASGLLFVTDGDLKISQNMDQSMSTEARILVREQFQMSTGSLNAQVVVQNVTSVSTVATTNTISGSASINYNATLPSLSYTAGGWREGP